MSVTFLKQAFSIQSYNIIYVRQEDKDKLKSLKEKRLVVTLCF